MPRARPLRKWQPGAATLRLYLETRKSKGWLGGQHLIVTTADGAQYGFGVKLDRWSADLANALTAHGCEARTTPQGMAVTSAPNA